MTIHLTRESDLAEQLDKPVDWIAKRRRRDRWPHVRLGRFDVRYTDTQIEEIVAQYVVAPKVPEASAAGLADGLTKRGAARNPGRSQ